MVTDEDIDLTPKTPTKDATLKALQDAGISLTVVGKKYDEKDFDPLVKGTNGLYLDIDKDFADLLNKQFSNYVIETVQEGRVYRIQTDTYEVIATTHLVTKQRNQQLQLYQEMYTTLRVRSTRHQRHCNQHIKSFQKQVLANLLL